MGPKKAAAPPERRKINYDNGRNLMTRDLKNWHQTHKDYYNEFKSSIEGAFLKGDEKTFFKLIGELRNPILPKDISTLEACKDLFTEEPVKLGEFKPRNTETVDWVSNDLDANLASKFHLFSADNTQHSYFSAIPSMLSCFNLSASSYSLSIRAQRSGGSNPLLRRLRLYFNQFTRCISRVLYLEGRLPLRCM